MEELVGGKGRPASSVATGGWMAALFIICVQVAERFAYYGVASNLISYLTGPMGLSMAVAAANVNAWSGFASLMPLLGGLLADAFIGRFQMIVPASLVYIVGLCLLSLFAGVPSLHPPQCTSEDIAVSSCPSSSSFELLLFFLSLYLVAIAQGCHKPCIQAFGADQFDIHDLMEYKTKSLYFNWSYFAVCTGIVASLLLTSYIQDNVSWVLGFGLPGAAMIVALVVFLLGMKTYHQSVSLNGSGGTLKLANALHSWWERFKSPCPMEQQPLLCDQPSTSLDVEDVLLNVDNQLLLSGQSWNRPRSYPVQQPRSLIYLVPIWSTCLVYAVVFSQPPTLFTKQGTTLDRRIAVGSSIIQLPPAALQSFITISICLFMPFYDRVIVPVCRRFSGKPCGLTMLQRIGTGLLIVTIAMVLAALLEAKRLQTAKNDGLVDEPTAVLSMSLWWLIPQYVLFGVSEGFTVVGLQEFFYDQMPMDLRSLGLGLNLSIFGVGGFISSFLVSVIDAVTAATGDTWFSDNLNRAHLDYFYWFLAGLSALGLLCYIYFARSYVYR